MAVRDETTEIDGGALWGLLGLVSLGAGGWALWHGFTIAIDPEANSEAVSRARRRWLVAGAALVVSGFVVLVKAG